MLAKELGFIQQSIDLNPLGAVGVGIGWVLMLAVGLVIRWALIRYKLHGQWRVVEWLLWSAILAVILLSLPTLAYVNARAWELDCVSHKPSLEYVMDKGIGTPFMAVIFSAVRLLFLIPPWRYPEESLSEAALFGGSLVLAACLSLGLTFGLARLHRLIDGSRPVAHPGH